MTLSVSQVKMNNYFPPANTVNKTTDFVNLSMGSDSCEQQQSSRLSPSADDKISKVLSLQARLQEKNAKL